MSIRWDSLLARSTARELHEVLAGARLRALRFDGRVRDIVLFFRTTTLLWRLHPERGFPLLLDALEPEPDDLRLKARVRRVYAPLDERIVIFELTAEHHGRGPYEVIVELLPNQLNAITTDGPDRTIRHVLRRRDGRRPARVGAPYTPPASTGRIGVDGGLSLHDWRKVVDAFGPENQVRELTRQVAWVSALNAGHFLGPETTPPESPPARTDTRAAGHRAWVAAAADGAADRVEDGGADGVAKRVGHGRADGVLDRADAAVLLDTALGPQPYPFALRGSPGRTVPTLLAGFEACAAQATAAGDAAPALTLGPELLASLEDALEHRQRRVVRLHAELDGLDDPAPLRAIGDLILARYAEIPRGASRLVTNDFTGNEVTVELDPELPPHENAARYYDRAGRSERAATRLPGLLEAATADGDRMGALLDAARAGTVAAETVRAALPPGPSRRRSGNTPPALPYRTFRSSGGIEIRVGRGSRHNDDLTFHHSSPNDVWLHARHTAGAHVILRWTGAGKPPARDLEEAATLAALHSKARTAGSVPVDWTLRKHVRKPRGSAAGSVVADRAQTSFVRPDPALLETLADRG